MRRGMREKRSLQQALSGGQRTGVSATLRLTAMRVGRGRRLLWAVGVGMLVVVTLICAVPLYINLGSDAQLQTALRRPPPDVNLEVAIISPTISAGLAAQTDAQLKKAVPDSIGGFAPTSLSYFEAINLYFSKINGQRPQLADPAIVPNTQLALPQVFAFDYTQTLPHMQIVSGRLPAEVPAGQPAETMATPQSGLKVGDVVVMGDQGSDVPQFATVRVVGTWFPKNEEDPFWNGRSFRPQEYNQDNAPPPFFPLLMTRKGFVNALNPLTGPSPGMTQHYVFFTRATAITARNMQAVAGSIKDFRAQLSGTAFGGDDLGAGHVNSRVSLTTALDIIIKQVQQQFTLSDQPLYIVVAQVVGLALLFVVTMAGLLVESQAGELAVLRSRGASGGQLLWSVTLRALVPAAIALIAGPLLAAALSLLLARIGIPAAAALITQNFTLPFIVRTAASGDVVGPALVGVALGLGAVTIPTWQATRTEVLAFRREQGRSSVVAVWRRLNLDLVLAAFCVVGYIELGQFGGLDVRTLLSQSGGGAADPLLLAAPVLLLLAGGLVGLRVFPWIVNRGARLAIRGRGATNMLAFAQLARAPGRVSRLVLLLTLAVGMGLFALTFQASLRRNAVDRAAYTTGGDVRVQVNPNIEGGGLVADIQAYFAKTPGVMGVTGITPLARTQVNTTPAQGGRVVGVLGVDPATFGGVAYWRDDYAGQPLSALLRQLQEHRAGNNAGQDAAPLWALVSPNFANALGLRPGERFNLTFDSSGAQITHGIVGAVVSAFPTMSDTVGAGYIVLDQADLVAAVGQVTTPTTLFTGPDEYWMRTSGAPHDDAARDQALTNPDLYVQTITDRRLLTLQFLNDPLSAGITTLLLTGALLAALLAVLGGVVQAASSVRQRIVQFAILRTLGLSRRELTRIFVTEQLAIYLFGLTGGTLLGLVLATATLPYLAFSTELTSGGDTAGGPPYVLAINPAGVLAFYAALALAFALALLWQRQVAARAALGRTLRLGED